MFLSEMTKWVRIQMNKQNTKRTAGGEEEALGFDTQSEVPGPIQVVIGNWLVKSDPELRRMRSGLEAASRCYHTRKTNSKRAKKEFLHTTTISEGRRNN